MADSVLPRRSNLDHRFFAIAAATVIIAVLVGFGPTFYLKPFFDSPPIARSIISLCRSLGLQVTVEGVERPSQPDFLVNCGDVSVQGYLVAHPSDAAEVLETVTRTRSRLAALLEAARLSRSDRVEETGGAVSILRRRR